MPKLISINISLPKEVDFEGQRVVTGIFKEPIEGRIILRTLNLDGDKQADLTVHGGPDKAGYAYPIEHYVFWRKVYPDMKMSNGMLGENFTTEGLMEADVNVGDIFRIGSSKVIATQPRMPCYKLGVKFGRMDVLKKISSKWPFRNLFQGVRRGRGWRRRSNNTNKEGYQSSQH